MAVSVGPKVYSQLVSSNSAESNITDCIRSMDRCDMAADLFLISLQIYLTHTLY